MQTSLSDLSEAIGVYKHAATAALQQQQKEDWLRLAAIAERLRDSLQSGDMAQARLSLLAFSRQVSDSYSTQPLEFKALSDCVDSIRKSIIS
jgi:hypothetical protein